MVTSMAPPFICTSCKGPETNTLFVSLVILNKVSHLSKGGRLWEVWNDPRSRPYPFLHSTSRKPLCFQTLRRCWVELELEEMALTGNYKMQNISSTLWRNSNRPLFLTLLNEFPLIKLGIQWVFKTRLLKVELLLPAFVHLLLTEDLGWHYEMHELP